jgi:Zn-finger nucleic acid-binding protein
MKKCPLCMVDRFKVVKLEEGPLAYSCSGCEGTWIRAVDYVEWLAGAGPTRPVTPATDEPQPTETRQAKLCPQDGHLLLAYKVGHDVRFTLDRCGKCHGVWFDPQEWEALKRRNLHDEVNAVFTEPWQRQVRREEQRRVMASLYQERFGAEDYAEIQRVRQWLAEHPHRSALLAYLMDTDPYRA